MSKLIIAMILGVLIIGTTTPVFAHDGHHAESVRDRYKEARAQVNETTRETRETVQSTRDVIKQKREEAKEFIRSQKDQIKIERQELKQKLEATRAERKTELAEKRLERCQDRQAKINSLIAKSAELGNKRLAYIQKVESNVKKFYETKGLTSTEYAAAATVVDEKEAAAAAVIEVTESQQFDCKKVDGSNPSGEIRTLRSAKRDTLNDYRDSVKQLIQIVKAAATANTGGENAS